ncbi:hypothetical protein [Microbacterium sp.]|uniref:hypothetical protein n=1 Tax=Microbacterium sp. TaxID=51671 RepID=UPI0039E54EA7
MPRPPILLAARGELPALLRDGDAATIDALRRFADRIGALIIGAEGRPLHLDPVATATVLAVQVPQLAVLVTSDGERDAPYNAARRFLSLDHLTGARSGVVFRGPAGGTARTAERIDVIRALWNSWPVATLLADRDQGVYATTDGIRRVAHEGAHYRVAGALNSPTSRQGEPVSLWHVTDAVELDAAHGLVDVVIIDDAELVERWRRSPEEGRPALAASPGTPGAALAHVEITDLATLQALLSVVDAPEVVGGSLRDRLGLPWRTYDLSDRPLAFGAAS